MKFVFLNKINGSQVRVSTLYNTTVTQKQLHVTRFLIKDSRAAFPTEYGDRGSMPWCSLHVQGPLLKPWLSRSLVTLSMKWGYCCRTNVVDITLVKSSNCMGAQQMMSIYFIDVPQ